MARWLRYLLLTLAACTGIAGAVWYLWHPGSSEPLQGRWRKARRTTGEDQAGLVALPYLGGYRPPSGQSGITTFDRDQAFPGINLYTSGHAPMAIAMGMDGRELWRWQVSFNALWPEVAAQHPESRQFDFWRRAWLFSNGDLLAIFDGRGLVKLDRTSRVLWSKRGGFHHDLEVAEDGSIYVLDRESKVIPRLHPKFEAVEDFITILGAGGKRRDRISLLEAFEHSPFASALKDMPSRGDVFHTNTLELLDGRLEKKLPAFKAGNILISVWRLNTIAVVDPIARRVVWALQGPWRRQHQPTVLDNANLLLFDNVGLDRDLSRVLEIDPLDGRVVWQYGGSAGQSLASKTLGSAQRLPNGNTLITESENGRAIEVTAEGKIVWEFRSPYRAGPNDELVAAVFEMLRLPPETLRAREPSPGPTK